MWRVEKKQMSDGSDDWRVVNSDDRNKTIFACLNETHARQLAEQLNQCAWIDSGN